MILGKRSKDITNQRFGALTALAPSHRDKNRTIYWKYLCDCGKEYVARGNVITNLHKKYKSKKIPSCGCGNLAIVTKHGHRANGKTHPIYRAFQGMRNRCYVPSNEGYRWYGAVGVTICKEWLDDPEKFFVWAKANGWEKGLHIDKDILCTKLQISPTIYSPETCQWVTPKRNVAQATNRDNFGKHPNVKLSHKDVSEIISKYFNKEFNGVELAKQYGVGTAAIYRLINIEKKGRATSNAVV